jgi:hypothetical protein
MPTASNFRRPVLLARKHTHGPAHTQVLLWRCLMGESHGEIVFHKEQVRAVLDLCWFVAGA